MTRNIDPNTALPKSFCNDHVRLDPSKKYLNRGKLRSIILLIFGLTSLGLLFYLLTIKNTLTNLQENLQLLVVFGSATLFVSIPLILYFYSPIILEIDQNGVTMFRLRKKIFIKWSQIQLIQLKQIPVNLLGEVQTMTIVVSFERTLRWLPIFDVNPTELAQYIFAKAKIQSPDINLIQ